MLLTQNLRVPRMSGRKPRSFPKQAAAYLNADKTSRTSGVVKRWSSQPTPYDLHSYNHDKHNNIWPEDVAIFMYEIVALKSKSGSYRQTSHNTMNKRVRKHNSRLHRLTAQNMDTFCRLGYTCTKNSLLVCYTLFTLEVVTD